MSQLDSSPTVLLADQEHAGIRILVPLILGVTAVAAFLALVTVLRTPSLGSVGDYWFPLSCLGGVGLGLALSAAAEFGMKRVWPSGSSLVLDGHGVEARRPSGDSFVVDWSKRFSTVRWHFALRGYQRGGRERRLPAGWHCLACQVMQDEHKLIVYSFMPKKNAVAHAQRSNFHQIFPGKADESGILRRRFSVPSRPDLDSGLLTGKEGRYWLAEKRRWTDGFELTKQDFEHFLTELEKHLDE